MKRFRVTTSRFVYAESDEHINNIITKELGEENAKGDTHPNLISLSEIPFGTMDEREISIL